jgi:hypothetical protein
MNPPPPTILAALQDAALDQKGEAIGTHYFADVRMPDLGDGHDGGRAPGYIGVG